MRHSGQAPPLANPRRSQVHVASMVNRLVGPDAAALPTVNVPVSRTAPRSVAGAVLPLAGVRAASSLQWLADGRL